MPEEVKLTSLSIIHSQGKRKPFYYLEDPSVISVISKNSDCSKTNTEPQKETKGSKNKASINDDLFEKELKCYINKSEPLEDSCIKYFKNFFCDHSISPDLRRWLWRERIGNPIRMNRTIFNTFCNRTSFLGICLDQEAVIKADLIRACSCLEDHEDKAKIFADLEKLIAAFVVAEILTTVL